jgi:putative ABC transport system permease protein
MRDPEHHPPSPVPSPLGGPAAALFRALLPCAERDEVLGELAAEHAERARRFGRPRARLWLWRQIIGSIPHLLRRTWWRGWTGFEPRASRMHSGGPVLESWIIDLRYSTRRLAARPTYAALAVLTLALGVGGTAAVFSIVRTLLLEPLPIAREGEVGVFWMRGSWTEQEFLHLRPEFPGFERVAAYRTADGATLELPGQPLRLLPGISASAELFDVLGARPLFGRTFQRGDDLPGAEPVVVLSHRLWQELGGEASILGRHLLLGGTARTVVGVMPPGFWFPAPTTQVWMARTLRQDRGVGELELVGRVADGFSLDAMDGPLATIVASLSERFQYPPGEWDKTRAAAVTPVREYLVGDVRPSLIATLAAMALILLIACVNVAALMLGQVGSRSSELAVRAALGAGRRRLVQQLAAEALMIGGLAGLTGALLAAAAFGLLVQSLPLGALAERATLDWQLFGIAMAVAFAASTLVALVPGMALWRTSLNATLATARTGGISARGGRLEGALVVAQIALAVLLAAGAALLVRSVMNLRTIDPGVEVTGVAVLDATVPTELNADARRRLYLDALRSLQAMPGVRAAAATQRLPLRGSSDNWGVAVADRPDLTGLTTAVRIVTHDYFEVLGVRVVAGRGFLPTDRAGTERVVVVNETLAKRYFGGADPLGRLLHTGFDPAGERIVGIVADVAEARLTDPPAPARYMLYEQVPGAILPETTFVLRGAGEVDVPALIAGARGTLARDAPRLAVHRVSSLHMVFDEAIGPAGQVVTLVSLLAALALVLGAIGVYGMISHYVTRRTREYGIRIALGLPPARVVWQVAGRGLRLVVLGSIAGLAGAAVSTRLLGSLLHDVSATDGRAFAAAVLALLVAGSLAAMIPARRASRTDPAVALREP